MPVPGPYFTDRFRLPPLRDSASLQCGNIFADARLSHWGREYRERYNLVRNAQKESIKKVSWGQKRHNLPSWCRARPSGK